MEFNCILNFESLKNSNFIQFQILNATTHKLRVLYIPILQLFTFYLTLLAARKIRLAKCHCCQWYCLITIKIDKLDWKHKKCHTIGKFRVKS